MSRKLIIAALAGAATILATPALGQRAGGGGPPSGSGGSGNAGGFGPGGPGGMGAVGQGFGNGMANGLGNAMNGMDMRDQARMNSQGPANASATGVAHANANSVLAGTTGTTTVTSGALAGLTTGATLYSNGTAVGTVQQIRLTGNGSVAMVVVKGTNGGMYAVPASKLSFSGGTLSTTARLQGINSTTSTAANAGWRANSQGPAYASATGIAHANQHSVLYGAGSTTTSPTTSATWRANSQGAAHASATGIAHANAHSAIFGGSTSTVTGVSVGMPLMASDGTQLGTVYRVVTANGVLRRVLVQGTNGRLYSLAPSTLTTSGGSLMTSASLRGM